MADLLFQQETIRRDTAQVEATRRRVETPKPLAIDMEAIERQYAAGGDWAGISARIGQSRPYAPPRAKFDMVIETGKTFAKTPLQKIMAALVTKSHGNSDLDELYRDFQPFDALAGKFFIDISNVDSDTDTDLMLQRLFLLGCQPVYDTFRDVNLATGLTSATWRVYFLSTKCPPPLLLNGSVCDQVVFDNKLHPAHGKDAPFQSERLPFGYRSHHGIDLGSAEPSSKHSPPNPTTTSAPSGSNARSNAPSRAKVIDIDDALSISTFQGSSGGISPPTSPMTKPKKMLMITDGFTTVSNKKKRTRGGVDFASMLMKQVPRPLDGVATKNYFQELHATTPDEDVTFSAKWKRLTGTAVPSHRLDIFKTCAKWWTTTEKTRELSRLTKALCVFELTLMSAAPTIFANDHWIQFVSGEPVQWIPAHHTRLLHTNTLLKLLRSDLGALCMEHWRQVQWQGTLLDELEELRELAGEYPDDESVLQLQVADGGPMTLVILTIFAAHLRLFKRR
ncbi:hypothetical protein PybrP1_005401, partial [[Pythium] brassicae (nom. inval.)]